MGRSLPPGFEQLGWDPSLYRMGDRKSFRGPCVSCGGSHRMVVYCSDPFPRWWLHCDLCGVEGWLDRFYSALSDWEPGEPSLSPTALPNEEQVKALQDQLVKQRDEYAHSRRWVEMHDSMLPSNRAWWRKQGIPDDWQDFWGLGYVEHRVIMTSEGLIDKQAYSIPKFDTGWRLVNTDYRIVDPPLGIGKYRPEPGLPAAYFLARPDWEEFSPDGKIVVVEGSKKAMVLHLALGVQVVGIPGCSSWAGAAARLQGMEPVVVLDPDAVVPAIKLAKAIGRGSRIMVLPSKPDDAFIGSFLDRAGFWQLVERSSWRITSSMI